MRRVLLAVIVTSVALLPAAPAAAHEGSGTIAVIGETPARPRGDNLRGRRHVDDDGHSAGDATVTAVVEQDGSPPATPVPLVATAVEGRYGGEVRFPSAGRWTVRFTAVSPVATLERSELIEADTSSPAPQSPSRPGEIGSTAPQTSEGGATGNMGLVGLVLALGGVGTIAALMVRSTRRTPPAPPPP